jgi:hypothetical protein
MKKEIVLLTLISVFLLSPTVVTSAQDRVVGLAPGDSFKCDVVDISWSSNDPNATFPPSGNEWLKDMNETEWTRTSVVNVSGMNITCQSTMHFKNGTEETSGGYIDIDTGTNVNMTFMAISADLEANDTIYASGYYSSLAINETIVRTYPDTVRDTNHLNMTRGPNSGTINGTEYYYYYAMNFYWDRSTGMLVEDSFEEVNQTGEYLTTWSALFRVTESNVWVVPEFPIWTSMLLLLTTLTATICIYKRRPLKTLTH